ncbi:NAD(P)-dependent alcohol dehydrogenase [Antrihabitans cavernicola]|uniref:NAD(P)-dependent alcohol dehydrogenase n=2 Tax=Antrihabitans cavernicola TaxID=2495913 RepID=A0A5A7S8C9_9NOCA|nr:NAD(P)-dependent alcohol dehydrogenase [Spelaeibacter cavernicola]
MQAMVHDEYGEAEDVLRLERVERPSVGDDEFLIRVHTAGVDRGAWHLMAGLPYPVRLAGYGVCRPRTRIRGREVAGIVAATGRNVTDFRVGDKVFGIAEGCFAEYAVGTADTVVRMPASLSFEQAAALPISGITALQAVRGRGQVASGQSVLIIGASGGVGTYAVQIAKALGATVTGVCSASKVDLVRSIGADHVIDYTESDIDTNSHYDVIVDTGGNRALRQLRTALDQHGTLVIVGSETSGRILGGTDRQLRALMLSPFVSQKLTTLIASEKATELAALVDLVESGSIMPVVDRAFPLPDTVAAIAHMRDGRARGKVVVTV